MSAVLTDRDFTNWVNEHADALFGYAFKRYPSTEIAKDLVQETFLAAWRTRDGFRQDASPKTWLFTIMKSKLIDHYRKSARKIEVTDQFHDTTDDIYFDKTGHWQKGVYPQPFAIDPELPGARREFTGVLDQCRKKLKEIQATVFIMKYIEDEDSDSICKQLNITPANYWVLLHRAKVQLRACLEKNWIN